MGKLDIEVKSWEDVQIAWGSISHAVMIHAKYIATNALFEINISHRLRQKLKKEFDDLKKLYIKNEEEIVGNKLEDMMKGFDKFNDNIRIYSNYPDLRQKMEIIFDETAKKIECLMSDCYTRF